MARLRALVPHLKQRKQCGDRADSQSRARSMGIRPEEEGMASTRQGQEGRSLLGSASEVERKVPRWSTRVGKTSGARPGEKPGVWAMPQLLCQHLACKGVQSKHLFNFSVYVK